MAPRASSAQTIKMIPLLLMSSSGSPGKLAVAAAGVRCLTSGYAGTIKLANFFRNQTTCYGGGREFPGSQLPDRLIGEQSLIAARLRG